MTKDVNIEINSTGYNIFDIEMVLNGRVNMTLKSMLEDVIFDIVSGKLVLKFDAVTKIHLPQEKEVRDK